MLVVAKVSVVASAVASEEAVARVSEEAARVSLQRLLRQAAKRSWQ
jgi:hypothetical protein